MRYAIESNLVKVSRVAEYIEVTTDESYEISSCRSMRTFILVSENFKAPRMVEFTLFIEGDGRRLIAKCIDVNEDGLNLLRLRGEGTEGFRVFEVLK